MASLNKVLLIGNLGADPETRYSQDGNTAITRLRIATSRRYKGQDGNFVEETEWHSVTLFGRTAQTASQYLRKGSSVYIEGRLRTRKYQDKNGQDRWVTEIIGENMQMLGGRSAAPAAQNADGFQSAQGQYRPASRPAPARSFETPSQPAAPQQPEPAAHGPADDEDIPF